MIDSIVSSKAREGEVGLPGDTSPLIRGSQLRKEHTVPAQLIGSMLIILDRLTGILFPELRTSGYAQRT